MRPGMRHPSPAPPLRPPQRLMPAANDGGVFFGGRDYVRRQQQQQQHNYPPQKPLLPPGALVQQWPNNNNVNYRTGLMPLTRGGGVPNPGPWHPRANAYRPTSRPSPPPPLSIPPHHHPPPPPHQFNPNAQTPISYVPPSSTTYDLMRLAAGDQLGQIPFLEPLEDEDALVRQHLASNNGGGGSDDSLSSSPSKSQKRSSHRRQHEKSRNIISYLDLDRPDESRDPVFNNRIVPSKSNHLPSVVVVAEKSSSSNHLSSEKKSSTANDQALKLELDRIKRAGLQEREKLKAQRQAAAEKEKEAQIKKNSVKTGNHEKREDGELGDSSDDDDETISIPIPVPKRLKKSDMNSNTIRSSAKTPPSSSESVIIDMSIMKLIRPMKLFRLDEINSNNDTSYRDYLTANYGRVRVHCNKPQPNFFSNLSCIEEIKRRYRLNHSSTMISSSHLLRHLIDDNDEKTFLLVCEPEDGEIESEDEGERGKKILKRKSADDQDKQTRKRSKLLLGQHDDGTLMEQSKTTTLSEKPWITTELRQLILQRNKLQAQILGGETNADVEKKFKKMRNKICKHARTLKAKYENAVSDSAESTANSQQSLTSSSAMAAAAAQHPLSSILDPALVMAMLVNPSLYSHVQQQVLSNPNFIQAYQHMLVDSSGTTNSLPKATSETQVVPSDGLMKQGTTSKSSKEQQQSTQQQQAVASARSRPGLTLATKPIQMTIGNELDNATAKTASVAPPGKSRFGPNTVVESSSIADIQQQQQEIALTQELLRRQLAAQQRTSRHPHSSSTLSLSTPLSRHIPLTSEQMQEVLTRAKNYVTRQQSDETTDLANNTPRLSYNTRRLQAAMAASASSATPQTAHAIGQAAAAAIAAVSARPSTKTASPNVPTPPTVPVSPVPIPSQQQQQQHPIRIQLDQKSKTLSSISNPQSLPIPTISQQKVMPITDVPPPPHMYPNAPNWQRPRLPVQHYPPPLGQPQHFAPLPYENAHTPYFGPPRTNFPPDMRPPSYGPRPSHLSPPPPPPRHLAQPRYNGPMPPYGYGHPPPHAQNYGPPPPPPHPHYGHHYPPP